MPRRTQNKPRRGPAARQARAPDAFPAPPETPDVGAAAKPALAVDGAAFAAAPDGGGEAQTPQAVPTGPPSLTKAGYWTRPPAEQLAKLPDAQLAALSGFAVGRTGYGLIEWEGAVDVRGLDLDAVVVIRHAGVDVYPRGCGLSPPVGSGLNRPAAVTLAERGVLAAAAAEQPEAAARGSVELRLQRRSADGARRVWTYAVPLAGGEATVLSTEGDDNNEQLEGRAPAPLAPDASEQDMQLNAVACAEAPTPAPEAALQLAALQPAARHALDDVDD